MDNVDPLAELLPESVRAALSTGELRLMRPAVGRRLGQHRSRLSGQGLEFRDHRAYSPGDDLRRLDWRAFARRDRPVLRQTEAETELDLRLLVDGGANMAYGEGTSNKWSFAAALACGLALLATRQGDRASFAIGREGLVDDRHLRARSSRDQVRALAEACVLPAQGLCPWRGLLEHGSRELRSRSLLVVFSDLWDLSEAPDDDADEAIDTLFESLNRLAAAGHDIVVTQVVHRDELVFPWQESQVMTACDPKALRPELEGPERELRGPYLAAIDRYTTALRRRADEAGVRLLLAPTDEDPGAALLRLLATVAGAPDPAPTISPGGRP